MGQGNLQQQVLYVLATILIVHELSLTTSSSSYFAMAAVGGDAPSSASTSTASSLSMKGTEMNVMNTFVHSNNPASLMSSGDGLLVNRLRRHTVQDLQTQQEQQEQKQQQQRQQEIEDASSITKRSFSTSGRGVGAWTPTGFNGLAGLAAQHTFRGNTYDIQQQQHQQQQYTEAKPVYEQQQESDYAGGGGVGGTTGVGNAAALHSAIYNLQTAGTHNAAVSATSGDGSNGGSDGFLPSWNFGKLSTSFIASPYGSSSSGNSNDKISEGNFLHHYDSASAFNEYTSPHQYEYQAATHQLPYHHVPQQQHQQQLQYENFYNNLEHTEADTSSSSSYNSDEHDNSNYLPSAPSATFQHAYEHQQQEKQPDVINYVPYPVVKKQHVPVRENIQIPVSHAVIIPVSKPVPIHIPVSQNIQVPIEKELKIPVERVVPYPIEKHVPVPVEKRVPYPVVKYVPIKIPRPFPVKVPVFKTVLHKVKGWW